MSFRADQFDNITSKFDSVASFSYRFAQLLGAQVNFASGKNARTVQSNSFSPGRILPLPLRSVVLRSWEGVRSEILCFSNDPLRSAVEDQMNNLTTMLQLFTGVKGCSTHTCSSICLSLAAGCTV